MSEQPPSKPAAEAKKAEGVYHKVTKGQTLWRIAKAYGMPVEDIIKSNNIPDVAAIETDQLIFIPGAREAKQIAPRTPDEKAREFAWPVKGRVISYFNDRRGQSANRGLDIEANEGDAVKACREGIVVMADYMAGYGQTLMIDHGDGFITAYAQNRQLLSKLGDHVYKGDPIAEAGRTGGKTFVHFELRKGETALNPLYYLPQ
ncbi:MAG: peptidoglycan DD-metalloendopeptidase family protein [Candidatus Omnitrophica bacterium]|nr:peptidoglycan DD-metalloendopeptidase family protein [Candidatus Omnitrophota bacterium]